MDKNDGLYADPTRCSDFYTCSSGRMFHQNCQPGLEFNVQTLSCDWSENVDCHGGRRPLTHDALNPAGTTFNRRPTTRQVPPYGCENKVDGFYPNPYNCALFYQCHRGEIFDFECQPGLFFNDAADVCDWPQNVDCQTIPQSTGAPGTTQNPPTSPTQSPPTQSPPSQNPPTISPPTQYPPSQGPTFTTPRSTATSQNPSGTTHNPPQTTLSQIDGCHRRVCYYTNWSQYRPGQGKFTPENVDPFLCTHIIFAFAKITGNELAPYEWNDVSTDWSIGMYEKVNRLKRTNPNLKTLLAVGGWTLGSGPFTQMVSSNASRQAFADQSLQYLTTQGFDGLDLDWEFPAARGSPPEDMQRFADLVRQLRVTYDAYSQTSGTKLLLTAAVSAGKDIIDNGYKVPEIAADLDFINVMTYDLHGAWEPVTGHNSPLYKHPSDTGTIQYLNVDWAARYWHSKGCPKDKLVIGVPLYGRSFTLANPADSGVGAAVSGAGVAGTYTREAGVLSYYEICGQRTQSQVVRDPNMEVPYLVNGDQWIGYDDITSLQNKVRYIKTEGYGGVMAWALPMDDFTGTFCGEGTYPLWSAVNQICFT